MAIKVEAKWTGKVFEPTGEVDLPSGERVTLSVTRFRRNVSQHRMFFAALAIAFDNWPEYHPFQPYDETQLRYWLEAKAGYGKYVTITDFEQVRLVLRQNYGKPIFFIDETTMIVPASVQYSKMPQSDFGNLVARVDEVLSAEADFTLDECKLEVITQPGGASGI